MSKLVYQPVDDFFIEVSLINLNTLFNEQLFLVEIEEKEQNKIREFLENVKNSDIICFPEYSYNENLYDIYKSFSDENNVIIIGGSGLEPIDDKFYAYTPVFIPTKDILKVYKKHITIDERTLSKGKLIPYPNPTERDFRIVKNDFDFIFSIFICYDFLQENYNERTDIVFIPQYETSPKHFINTANSIVQGRDNFVFGVNNSDNTSLRSLGFANLNKSIMDSFIKFKIRKKEYKDNVGEHLLEHFTLIYDVTEERVLTFRLNLAKPVPKPYNFSRQNYEPNVMLI